MYPKGQTDPDNQSPNKWSSIVLLLLTYVHFKLLFPQSSGRTE